jgi:hypothetical protein
MTDDDALAREMSALTPWHQQYKRMMRWRERLDEPGHDEQRRHDDFYAFFVTAYHLADWIKNDTAIADDIREAVWGFRHTGMLAIAADVANGYKHLARDRKPKVDGSARVAVQGTFAISEGDEPPQAWQHWVVVVGETMPMQDAYELADRCIMEWNTFLDEHSLTTPPTP